jgi:hypothetical protein
MSDESTPASDTAPGPQPVRVAFHEGSIALPEGFEDRTANVFVPANPQVQPNLSIARDWMKDGETLGAYIDRQLGVLKSQFAGHKLILREAAVLGEGEAALRGERIDDQYKSGKLVVYKRQAAFVVASNPPGQDPSRRVLILTATTPRGFTDAFEDLWSRWIASYVPPVAAPDADAATGIETNDNPTPEEPA